MYPLATTFADLLTQTAQGLHVPRVDRQGMIRHVTSGILRVSPSLESSRAAVQDIVLVWARQGRIERHVERQIHKVTRHRWDGAGRHSGHRPLADVEHVLLLNMLLVVLWVLRLSSREAHPEAVSRMAVRADEILDLMHALTANTASSGGGGEVERVSIGGRSKMETQDNTRARSTRWRSRRGKK